MQKNERDGVASEASHTPASVIPNISPARLHTIIAGLWLCLFISAIDGTIVTTALVKISNGFNSLEQGAWLVTAYLLTYNCKSLLSIQLHMLTLSSISTHHGKIE
jgi:hypothetical protein